MHSELNNELYDLIIRYLDGSASRVEEQQLQSWIEEDQGNLQVFDSIKVIWEGAEKASVFEKIDVDDDWQLFQSKAEKVMDPAQPKSPAKIFSIRRIVGIAAGLALILVSYYAYVNLSGEQGIREIALADGSKVWLNDNATLDYPSSFSGEERMVTLTGQAFFDVAENPEMPFVINTSESRIMVLGTSFNVRSDDAFTEVIVESGKVALYDNAVPEKKIILTKGQRGFHSGDDLISMTVDNPNYLAWKTGILNFEGTPIRKALADVSAISDKPVRLDAGAPADCVLRAKFDNEPVTEILETVALSCGLSLKEYKNAYVLSEPGE